MKEILFLVGFVVILIIFLSFYLLCRIQSKNSEKIKSHIKSSQNLRQPAFYGYSAAQSADYLGKLYTTSNII